MRLSSTGTLQCQQMLTKPHTKRFNRQGSGRRREWIIKAGHNEGKWSLIQCRFMNWWCDCEFMSQIECMNVGTKYYLVVQIWRLLRLDNLVKKFTCVVFDFSGDFEPTTRLKRTGYSFIFPDTKSKPNTGILYTLYSGNITHTQTWPVNRKTVTEGWHNQRITQHYFCLLIQAMSRVIHFFESWECDHNTLGNVRLKIELTI